MPLYTAIGKAHIRICVLSQYFHFPANWATTGTSHAARLSSYLLSAIADAINAASSPTPYNAADFSL